MPKLSFVVPAYNEDRYISKCLDAILFEIGNRKDVEIIVADNNSSDRTAEIVAHYPSVKLISERRRGANSAREAGFLASSGDLVAFLDADTQMPPGWIARSEEEFSKNDRLVCLSGPFIYYDLPRWTRILVRLFYLLAYLTYLMGGLAKRATVMQGGNYIVRRWALEKIGGHNVKIAFYGDDTDLALRLSKIGKVKFSFRLPILASGRRLAKEGAFTTGWRYTINNLWMVIFRRPFNTASEEVRFGPGGTIYQPEHKWKERLVAAGFTLLVLLFLGILLIIAYYLIVAAVVLTTYLTRIIRIASEPR